MLEIIEQFIQIQELLLADQSLTYVRNIYNSIDWQNRLIGIVGSRGVGKTTLILQHIKKQQSTTAQNIIRLYLSADSTLLGKASLFDLAKTFHLKKGGSEIYIDEVHRLKNWSQELKTIYDALPKLKVVFSGSSQINILQSRADLARRSSLYTISGLSFREYLELESEKQIAPLTLNDLFTSYKEKSIDQAKNPLLLPTFKNYLSDHYYPYYRENKNKILYYQKILNSVDKTIFEDIASLFNLQTENLIAFKEILVFLSSITPGEINIHKVAQSIGKKDDTVKSYLQILSDSSLIRFLPNSLAGHAKLKAAEKIYFDNTNMLRAFCYFTGKPPELGMMRETFIVNQLQSAGHIPLYTKFGDFRIGDTYLEVGGVSKGRHQLPENAQNFVVADDTLIAGEAKIPLYLFGFLY